MSTTPTPKGITLFVEVIVIPNRMEEFLGHYSTMLRQITLEDIFFVH